MLKALMFGCSIVLLGAVGTASGQDWTKSKWGPNDEIGAANNLSPDIVVKAAGLIKTGKTYGLGIETNSKTPAFPPRTFKVLVLQPGQAGGNELGPNKTTYNDDIIEGWVGIGSQIDGLGHIGVDWTYYNGLKSGDFAAADGLKKLGVEKIPPLVTQERVRGAPDSAAYVWHLHPGEHEHGTARRGQGLRVPVRAGHAQNHWRRAGHYQSGGDPLKTHGRSVAFLFWERHAAIPLCAHCSPYVMRTPCLPSFYR